MGLRINFKNCPTLLAASATTSGDVNFCKALMAECRPRDGFGDKTIGNLAQRMRLGRLLQNDTTHGEKNISRKLSRTRTALTMLWCCKSGIIYQMIPFLDVFFSLPRRMETFPAAVMALLRQCDARFKMRRRLSRFLHKKCKWRNQNGT